MYYYYVHLNTVHLNWNVNTMKAGAVLITAASPAHPQHSALSLYHLVGAKCVPDILCE